jgi:hypothetical protein
VFALTVAAVNRQTRKTAHGKLSLIDLAGSERVSKTGATAERLREAQAINKSLSALGNVISALSAGEAFVPYRDHKLTMLMSDSLGGNAKTLMLVNVSPSAYNAEETTTSLQYAARVKLITNSAQRAQESAEVARLKAVIAALRAGKALGVADGAGEFDDDGGATPAPTPALLAADGADDEDDDDSRGGGYEGLAAADGGHGDANDAPSTADDGGGRGTATPAARTLEEDDS